MRALITGFGGFAGGHLADLLADTTDWEVWGTVFHPDGRRPGTDDGPRSGDVSVVQADLRSPDSARETVDISHPDIVFHLAGQASVPDAWSDPWPTFETNVRMQLNILQAVVELAPEARVVAITSNEVYGRVDEARQPTDESAPLRPINPYATSKASQDLVVGQYVRSHALDTIRVRPFTHIGPGQDSRFVAANFAMQVAQIEAGLRDPVIRVGDLSAERDFTDVRDMVRGYLAVAQRGTAGAVYNLGSGTSQPVRAIVDFFLDRSRVPIRVSVEADRFRPADIPKTLCDPSRARADVGWHAEIPFDVTLEDILADWRARIRPVEA